MSIRCITSCRPQSAWERFCGALCRCFKALTGGKGTNSMG